MHARYPPKSMSSCEYRILPLLLLLPPAIPALNMMISRSSKRASPTPPPAGNSARNPPPNARKISSQPTRSAHLPNPIGHDPKRKSKLPAVLRLVGCPGPGRAFALLG
ncbi:hypothetical protein HDK77DRAFT_130961 [Phyllosticta capitalensis]